MKFDPGNRVRVNAPNIYDGPDRNWHIHEGTVDKRVAQWHLVYMDKKTRGQPTLTSICSEHLIPLNNENVREH
jgi:hypothetical protein